MADDENGFGGGTDYSQVPEAWRSDPAFGLTMMSGNPDEIARHMTMRGLSPPGEGQNLVDWAAQTAPQGTMLASAGTFPGHMGPGPGEEAPEEPPPGPGVPAPRPSYPPLVPNPSVDVGPRQAPQQTAPIPATPAPANAPTPQPPPDTSETSPDPGVSRGQGTEGQGPNQYPGTQPEQQQRKAQSNQPYKDKQGIDLGKILAGVSALQPPKPNIPGTPPPYQARGQAQPQIHPMLQTIINQIADRAKLRTLGEALRGR